MRILEVDGLAIVRDGRPVVEGLSFSASRGERLALMGPSGTGKTTVLRALAGLERPAAGTIGIDGVRITSASSGRELQRRVGLVFQFHHLFAHMSALQNVWLAPVHVFATPQAEAERRARALLEKLGVAHRAAAMPHELSGGEAQRVAIARALAVNPPVLLMDEPTASLDPERRGELAATLRQLAADGTTLLVATHDAVFARAWAERILVLGDGRLVRDAAASEVLS
jgi:ABC-type polar amino acid transport system ATPase subunit